MMLMVFSLLTVARGAQAQERPNSLPILTVDKKLILLPETPATAPALDINSLTLAVANREWQVSAVGRTGDWSTVVYLDPALATPDGIRTAAAALTDAAGMLTDLGTVEVVVADPFTDTWLEASRSREDLWEVLEELEDLADAAGEIVALREELAEDASELDEDGRQQAVLEEVEILQESRRELIRWLSRRSQDGPRLLLLIQDGFDLSTAPPEVIDAHNRVAMTLAASGWIVMPMVPASTYAPLLPERFAAMDLLADSSGGMVIEESEHLALAAARLANAVTLRATLSGVPDGVPKPTEVRSAGGPLPLRTARWTTLASPITLTEIRALQTLEEPDLTVGPWSTAGLIRPDPEAAPASGRFPAILEAMTELRGAVPANPYFRLSLLLVEAEAGPSIVHDLATPTDLAGAEAWLYRKRLAISEELAAAAVVVEELHSGQWGSAPLELTDRGFPTQGRRVAVWEAPDRLPPQAAQTAMRPSEEEDVVIRVLPPKKRPVSGKTRFETLVSSPIVDRVTFSVDGEPLATDDKAPFSASVDLGSEIDMHQIRVDAYAANGTRLGSHQITINPRDDSFLVRITDIANPLGGIQTVTAEVRVPRDSQLDRVEFYWNETLVDTLRQGPFQIELPVPDPGAQAFVRVAAYLQDGTWIDDAQLLGDGAISDRVQVNLVELHVMVTDRDNKPIEGLEIEDFTVRLDRQEQKVERLGFAEDVPLVLGVVIDTSESMWPLMVDTQKAGAQFVANTLAEGDSAFLVDFDTQPRLAQESTTDVMTLLKTFSRFQPDGLTALYDAIIFSMLQFEEAEGRKALVLLSDGDDVKSRYGPRRCIQYGKRLGVPVYIISLAGVHNARRNLRRIDLEGITEGTGGQVFYITEMSELAEAYDTINRELRSQYILTFSTDRELTELELEGVEVTVEGKGLSVRGVVGGQQVQ